MTTRISMKYKKIQLTLICFIFFLLTGSIYASEFDELDKPPEGIHKNQFILIGSVQIGMPYGDLISAEEKFTKTSTYTFDNEITKLIYLSHLAFGISISAEYMPVDYLGIRIKFRRGVIVQHTNFGKDYESWKKTLYSDYTIYSGLGLHITNRKPWDISVSPLIGYSFATYYPTPIAKKLIVGYQSPPTEEFSSVSYGAELILSVFFSGGFVIQIGSEWIRNPVKFSSIPDKTNPQTNQTFYTKKDATIDSILFCVSAGYAFYN